VLYLLCQGVTASGSPTLKISEICVIPSCIELYPAWIEIHNETDKPIDISGYIITGIDSVIYTFSNGNILPANGYVVMCFYENDQTIPVFESLIDKSAQIIRVSNSKIFTEDKELPNFYIDINILKKYPNNKDLISRMIHETTVEKYRIMAKEYCQRHGIDNIYEDAVLLQMYYQPQYHGSIAIISVDKSMIDSVSWNGCVRGQHLLVYRYGFMDTALSDEGECMGFVKIQGFWRRYYWPGEATPGYASPDDVGMYAKKRYIPKIPQRLPAEDASRPLPKRGEVDEAK
jgi:hypothetical protein